MELMCLYATSDKGLEFTFRAAIDNTFKVYIGATFVDQIQIKSGMTLEDTVKEFMNAVNTVA